MRIWIVLFTLGISVQSYALKMGFNQGWLNDQYGSQWIDYDRAEAERVINLTKNANAKILRMWLFEGFNNKALS